MSDSIVEKWFPGAVKPELTSVFKGDSDYLIDKWFPGANRPRHPAISSDPVSFGLISNAPSNNSCIKRTRWTKKAKRRFDCTPKIQTNDFTEYVLGVSMKGKLTYEWDHNMMSVSTSANPKFAKQTSGSPTEIANGPFRGCKNMQSKHHTPGLTMPAVLLRERSRGSRTRHP